MMEKQTHDARVGTQPFAEALRAINAAWVRCRLLVFVDRHIDNARQIAFTKFTPPPRAS